MLWEIIMREVSYWVKPQAEPNMTLCTDNVINCMPAKMSSFLLTCVFSLPGEIKYNTESMRDNKTGIGLFLGMNWELGDRVQGIKNSNFQENRILFSKSCCKCLEVFF